MNLPTPAIVAERGAQRLPRLALLLFCAAYVLPGLFGRDPWRNADLTAYGFMASIAEGHAPWWKPAIAGIAAEGGPLPYWIGALAIKVLPFLDPAFAARLPYALALALVLVLTWYSSFHLARTDAAQPVAFAFGGEAHSVDYARALADGALLALIATLGLLQLGHETTPELLQLLAMSLYLYGLAAAPFRAGKSRWALLIALPVMGASGAPLVAMTLALLGAVLCRRSHYEQVRGLMWWLLAAGVLAALSAWEFRAWAWRIAPYRGAVDLGRQVLSLFGWFCWPAWPLALWTLWRWRIHWQRRHILVPLVAVLVPILASILMGGVDRALLLALPALAVLAAFALPTLKRSIAALMDWFSVFFFSACALFVWIYYLSMQLGWPAQPLANLRKLMQGFEPSFHPLALLLAALATIAWLALVRWRTARHQHALWKSLVLPAGGVALGWLLMTTLMLAPLDYARSNTPLVERLRALLPAEVDCIAAPGQALSTLAALEFQGGWRVEADKPLSQSRCSHALQAGLAPVPEGWAAANSVRRPTDRQVGFTLLRRQQ
ncbi:hypothetical protein [Roseateles violae]|uniref:4-amino-4-deoxy-L-arabinose transferase-like glycosyltransferase n=1 Tax=Roseateles violae TaxID=3058042 RepID=A0ABT8DQE3_9BURK|nr:hypothetical protein [Pelomonas sp. PFR6]MDN3920392.1 hypothetical protein [Pelomonas sp. PFR6]